MTLNQLPIGRLARIAGFVGETEGSLLDASGLYAGSPVQILRRGPCRGPFQVQTQGALYAISEDYASKIQVVVE